MRDFAAGVRNHIPPRAAITLALVVLVSTSAVAGFLYLLAGGGLTLAFLLGATAGVPSTTAAVATPVRLVAGSLCILGAVGGTLVSSSPWGCAALVGALALAQAPLTQRAAGIGMFAPVIAAIFATVDVGSAPLVLGIGTGIGFGFIHGMGALLKLPRASSPVDRTIAWFHAGVFALFAIPGVYITRSLELGHGSWLVLTLAAVLRPVGQDCREAAWGRLTGTVSGIGLAVAMGLLLPSPVVLVFAAAFAVLMVAWAVCKNVERQTLFGTPVILLLVSGGRLGEGVELSVERLALTAIAAGLAVAAASALERLESRSAAPPPVDGGAT